MREPSDPQGAPSPEISLDWLAEFEAAAKRPLETRMRYAFIHTYKPVMDDAKYRAFDTMKDYRRWCEENLPVMIQPEDLPEALTETKSPEAALARQSSRGL